MATKKTAAKDFDDVGGGHDNRRKPSTSVRLFDLPDKKYLQLRPLPGTFSYGGHWVKTVKKDGSKGSFYMPCSAFDTEDGKRLGNKGVDHCAFCAYEARAKAAEADPAEIMSRFAQDYYFNALIRNLQKKLPDDYRDSWSEEETESGFLTIDSEAITPVAVIRLPFSATRQVSDLKQLNSHDDENGETQPFSVGHPKYGCDISILKDTSKPAAQMYAVQKGEHTPLKKAELKYLKYDLSDIADYLDEEEVAEEYEKWITRNKFNRFGGKKSASEDSEEDEVPVKRKKRVDPDDEDDEPPVKKTAKKRVVDDDDDEDTPPPKKRKAPVDDDDDDEAPPKRKVKKVVEDDDDEIPTPKKRKVPVEDDDEDEPKPKAKKKPIVEDDDDEPVKAKSKKRPPVDEDYDEEEAPKSKAKKVVVEDDDDDDIPPPRKKKPVVDDDDDEPPVKKKAVAKKRVDPDDEDDEPAPKSKKRKPVDDEDDGLD